MTEKRVYNKLDFSPDEEVQIIDYVKQHPILYNPKNPDYKNKTKRDKIWNDLGIILNKPGYFFLFC